MDRNRRGEICRFEEDDLLYRVDLFENREVAFLETCAQGKKYESN